MALNCDKRKEPRVCYAREPPELTPVIDNREIQVVSSATLLGVVFSDELKWQAHVDHIHRRQPRNYTF